MLISISQYECPCIFCNQCTQHFSLFLLFQFRRPHHRQAAQHLKIRYLKKLKWCDAQSYEECLQLLLHQLEWLMLLHDMCPEYFYVNDPLYTCKRLSWDHFHIYQSRLDFYQIFTQTHPQVQGFQSTASTAILKISQLIIDYKNQDRSIQLLDEYSKMGNQVCISQEAQNSTSIKTTDKKEQLNSITHAQKSSACANSESIYFENLQEMDEGSPASKFDIKFLRTNVRASNRKHADISFSSTQPQFTKKKAKYFHTKNHTEQTKKFLQEWQIDYLQFAMKLDTEKSTERKKLAIKSYSNFITRKQNNFIEMKISGQNFYKLRHQSIVPYYQINKKIGQGSFGSVYKGKCLKTGQMRAIKILKKKIMNQLDQKTLISEINILKKMDHINIIKLYDVFFHKNFFYVVTQYCQGGSLLEALQKQLLKSQKQVAVIVRQLVSAVSYMHKLKIAHRDLKLDNIVLVKQITQATKNNISIKLIDFGLAQAVEYDYKNKTGLVGTVSYMAPQIFTGFYSLKSDVWSCGIILCMLLIGYNPFKKKKQNLTMKSIECQQISFVSMDWAKVSLKARNLIGQMLTKTPEKRISIDHVLNHDWLRSLTLRQTKEIITSDYRSEFVISNFNNYNRGSNFICYIKNFLISRQLTQTTRQQMALIFQKIDTDSSGVIDRQELIELYNLVTGITNEEIERLIQKIDQNKSGKIDFQQFLICMTHNQILRNKECINEAFDFLDQDKTGYIEKEQLFQCLDGCEQEEVVRVIKQADFNGDGKISRQQFTSYLMKVQL